MDTTNSAADYLNTMHPDELAAIDNVLTEAIELGLEIEVIYWALVAMKKDSSMSPSEAMTLGILEWIK